MRFEKFGGRLPRWVGVLALIAVLASAAGASWLLASAGPEASLGSAAMAGPAEMSSSTAGTLPSPVQCGACWRPGRAETWQIELSDTPQPPYLAVGMIEVDGFDTPASTVAALHHSLRGRGVVCYIDAGTWENWRPDAGEFPQSLLGRDDSGWPGERWLDIASYPGALARIMRARTAMCKSKGFNAVDFDNVDGYANNTGFRLTAADQLRYDVFLANTAHRLGLAVALKNDLSQIPVLIRYFNFAVDEQCFQYAECTTKQNGGFGLDEFTRAGKAVFDIEYSLPLREFCPAARRDHFNALRKHLSLDAWRQACP
jgi:endo-alpha-1,4-polygalactosaminidase (GH114 family)